MIRSLPARVVLAGVVAGLMGAAVRGETIYGMTVASSDSGNPGVALVSFDSATPATITTIGAFTGVVAGHGLRSIDFRPATGVLYAISTNGAAAGQLYTVNLTTAALTPIGMGFTLGSNITPRVSMDFNPVADRIRVVTGGLSPSNNFRVNPNDGSLITDSGLVFDPSDPQVGYIAFQIIGIAYTNNAVGGGPTTLYAWDFSNDALIRIGGVGGTPSPNSGLMYTQNIPGTYLTFNAALGFDISGDSGVAYVCHDDPGTGSSMALYTRNLTTGAQTLVGQFPPGVFLSDISTAIPATGACCNLRTGGCTLMQRLACVAVGLQFAGTGTACSPVTCHGCAGDFDQNGTLGVTDIFVFLTAWFAGCP